MISGGYIRLYRQVREHWTWQDPVVFQRWMDLLLTANHKPGKMLIKGKLIALDCGELFTSFQALCARWDVGDERTVKKFLNLLKNDGMITVTPLRGYGTIIKITNYALCQSGYAVKNAVENGVDSAVYDAGDNAGESALGDAVNRDVRHAVGYADKQEPKEPEEPKEPKREGDGAAAHTPAEKKPVKHRHGEFGWVRLSDDEYSKLTAEYGEAAAVYYIGVVDSKAEQTGNKNGWKNWNLTVRNAIRGKWTVAGESPPSAHGRPKKRTMKTVTDADGNIHSEWED